MSERDAQARDGDRFARKQALDVTRSFLVQAPAGSGKTELLIQRFLALLASVDRPERIVAMTFTRKAAGEMRRRIADALHAAERCPPPEEPHELVTFSLAKAALAQDRRHGWRLDAHPARLAVQTIDAFCTALARQAPLATGLGEALGYAERPRPLYEAAVRAALAAAEPDDESWRTVLAHLDNDAEAAVRILSDLLAKRERILPLLKAKDLADFRVTLEETLVAEIEGELGALVAAFPGGSAASLAPFERYAADHPEGGDLIAALAPDLVACAEAGGLPSTRVEAAGEWRALANWLLVKDKPQFRKRIDKSAGFPPKTSGKAAAERVEAASALFAELGAVPGLAEALDLARKLPAPGYTEGAWSFVAALTELLPRLCAELLVEFGAVGTADFAQGTIAALDALGTDDAPSDLLLKLDNRIQHVLVDEFQDTSYVQVELLHRVIAGWQPDDGRTLFCVGDPMQSIYRFRGAEVRGFLDAQAKEMIAGFPVERLELTRNFRSHAGLVDWVNDAFPRVLPATDDPYRGAVSFLRSTTDTPGPKDAVTVEVVASAEEEAALVVRHVEAARKDGLKVAVLVRARTHLDRVLPALREAGIEYAAVELDALAERQSVVDLAALTHAITQPADRLAWLSVLRAPWCGLSLPDLFAVTRAAEAHGSGVVAELVVAGLAPAGIGDDGRRRFAAAARALAPALAVAGRVSLSARVRGAWLALGGPASLTESIDVDASERYFALLSAHEVAGDIPDWAAFVGALDDLRASSATDGEPAVQVMTLHKAKGLQFEAVIMPGLGRKVGGRDTDVLRFRARPKGILLGVRRASGVERDTTYDYLGRLAAGEERNELGRLLYVGTTRAKKRLHLTAVLGAKDAESGKVEWAAPGSGTALEQLWPVVARTVGPPARAAEVEEEAPPRQRAPMRVPADWRPPAAAPGVPVAPYADPPQERIPFDWARETAKHVGVVAHRLFAQVAREGLAAWNGARVAAARPRIRTELAGEGVDDADLERAADDVTAALANALADRHGRFVLDDSHGDAASEWALAGVDEGAVAHVVLDRTFVADGVRWIVDFKTGRHQGGDVDAFLASEVERYAPQLERYARFVRALDARPIRLALYYPLLPAFRDWAFAG